MSCVDEVEFAVGNLAHGISYFDRSREIHIEVFV